MNKIYLVNDYISPHVELPNGINFDYFYSYVEAGFDENNDPVSILQEKYYDGVGVWKGEGAISYALDGEVSTYDVYNGNYDKSATYLYTISPFGGASCTYGLFASLHHGRSFYFFIPERTKELIRTLDNFYLFINYANEGTMDHSFFEVIYRDAEMFNIPTDKIIFCISDYNIHNTHNVWFNDGYMKRHANRDRVIKPIKTLYHIWSLKDKAKEFDRILNNKHTSFGKFANKCSVVSKELISNNHIRNKKFLMLNRRLRPHRIYSVLLFHKLNILDQFLVSYDLENLKMFDLELDMYRQYHLRDEMPFDVIKSSYEELKKLKPVQTIDYQDLTNVWGFNFENKEIYLNSYIHITSETNFFEQGGYFSEKVWKPIGHLQPFIFMGPAHGLAELKKLGFKTFSPFIDESYDDVGDNAKRFKLILNEIERISKLPLEEIHEWYHSIFEDVILYNQNLFLSYKDENIMKEFFRDNLSRTLNDNT